MKVLVAYISQTGNTKKVAKAIFQEIQAEKDIKELKDVDSLEGYNFTFVGFPMHYGGPAKPAKNFLEKHTQGKKIALFVTHATREDSKGLQKWLKKCKKAATGADLVGFFNCQGKPDATRLERACVFAKDVMTKEMGKKGKERGKTGKERTERKEGKGTKGDRSKLLNFLIQQLKHLTFRRGQASTLLLE